MAVQTFLGLFGLGFRRFLLRLFGGFLLFLVDRGCVLCQRNP